MSPTKKDKARSCRLVVDASVLRAAGRPWPSKETGASQLAELLNALWEICHRAVFNAELRDECENHESKHARTWRVRMAKRQKWLEVSGSDFRVVAKRIESVSRGLATSKRRAVKKDLHLITAALCGDGIILSLDDTARSLFADIAAAVPELGSLLWVNPLDNPREVLDWLAAGAPDVSRWRLAPDN